MTHQYTKRMVQALMGAMILIVSLFAFGDGFPSWLLKVMIATAFLLPVGPYFTIVVQPGSILVDQGKSGQ